MNRLCLIVDQRDLEAVAGTCGDGSDGDGTLDMEMFRVGHDL